MHTDIPSNLGELKNWFDNHKDIDTVWHVARACRTEGTRRDAVTFLLDTGGLVKILGTRAKSCRFVYASSKIVYGLKGGRHFCTEKKCRPPFTNKIH